MILLDSQGREVFDAETDGSGVDTFFCKAVYEDGSLVSDDELDYLSDMYPAYLQERAFDRAVMAAESHYEGDR